MKLRKKQNTFPLQEQKLLQLTTTCRGKSLCMISWGRLCRGKLPEKAPGKLCSMKTREAELSRVEGSMAGAAEKEGKAGTQPGSLKPGKLQRWPPCFGSLVRREVQLAEEKLQGGGGLQGVGGGWCSVRSEAEWCLMPWGDGEVRGQFL